MSKSILDAPPSGLVRSLLRLPILLYRLHLGWVLGDRFLLLHHTGRKSGRVQETVVEVVRHDGVSDTYYVVSGWGAKSDWYLNIQNNPLAIIRVGAGAMQVRAVKIPLAEAAAGLGEYSKRYTLAFRERSQVF